MNSESVACDCAGHTIKFKFVESSSREYIKKVCIDCGSTYIIRNRSQKICKPGGGKWEYLPARYRCIKCKTVFQHPKEIIAMLNKNSKLPKVFKMWSGTNDM